MEGIGGFTDFIGSGLSGIWDGLTSGFDAIGKVFTDTISWLMDGIKGLFVPKEGFIEQKFGDVNTAFSKSMPVIGQLGTMFDNIRSALLDNSSNINAPKLEFEYRGAKVQLIDFEVIRPYRDAVHGVLLAVIYIAYFWNLYHHLPGIINGIPSMSNAIREKGGK